MNGCTFRPAAELMMITEPPPAATRCGAPAITVFQVPVTLVLSVSSKICGVVLSHAFGTQIPALATITSSRPSSPTALSTMARSASRSRMSTMPLITRRPVFSTARTVSSRSSGVAES